jgi:hypothetical protein
VYRVEGLDHHGLHGSVDGWSGGASPELAPPGVVAHWTLPEVVREGECSDVVLTMGGNRRSSGANGWVVKGIDAMVMVLGDNAFGARRSDTGAETREARSEGALGALL